ncbi:MAG: hypothetical protein O7G85_10305 [Planctomycetota bacterium]|nr:hypothetical protein [Planctomycetota bacterium]
MSNIDAIERRLSALELDLTRSRRDLRRYRGVMLMLVFGLIGLGTLAANQSSTISEVIQAKRFEVVDDDGHLVLALSSSAFGGQLDLWNKTKQNLLRLSGSAHGGDIALWNKDGVNVYGAYATRDGAATSLWNKTGRSIFTAYTQPNGGGKVEVSNLNGQTVAALSSVHEVGGVFALLNDQQQRILLTGAHQDGGAMNIFNNRGIPIFIVGYGPDHVSGEIGIRNGHGNQIFGAGADTDGNGHMTIYNTEGGKPRTFSAIR